MSLQEKIDEISLLALEQGYELIKWQKDIRMLSFRKEGTRINIYTTKMTVATALEHPKKGKTQLYRKGVSLRLLGEIFKNPRHHSGKGYYTK